MNRIFLKAITATFILCAAPLRKKASWLYRIPEEITGS